MVRPHNFWLHLNSETVNQEHVMQTISIFFLVVIWFQKSSIKALKILWKKAGHQLHDNSVQNFL